jgi:hypothetical protein
VLCVWQSAIIIHLIYRAGKPPVGTHLDVMKGEKLIQVSSVLVNNRVIIDFSSAFDTISNHFNNQYGTYNYV